MEIGCDELDVCDRVVEIWHACYEFIEHVFNSGHMNAIEMINVRLMVEYTKQNHKQ